MTDVMSAFKFKVSTIIISIKKLIAQLKINSVLS